MNGADAFLHPLRQGRVCFDTTVPRHFAQSGFAPLLLALFGGRACWPEAVEIELTRQVRYAPDITTLIGGGLGLVEPILDSEEQDVVDLQLEQLTRAEYATKPTMHRGESECLVICKRLGLPLVMHDGAGRDHARRRGVEAFTAVDVIYAGVREGQLEGPDDAWAVYTKLCRDGMLALKAFAPGQITAFFRDQCERMLACRAA